MNLISAVWLFSVLVLETSSNAERYSACSSTPTRNSDPSSSVFACIRAPFFFPVTPHPRSVAPSLPPPQHQSHLLSRWPRPHRLLLPRRPRPLLPRAAPSAAPLSLALLPSLLLCSPALLPSLCSPAPLLPSHLLLSCSCTPRSPPAPPRPEATTPIPSPPRRSLHRRSAPLPSAAASCSAPPAAACHGAPPCPSYPPPSSPALLLSMRRGGGRFGLEVDDGAAGLGGERSGGPSSPRPAAMSSSGPLLFQFHDYTSKQQLNCFAI